MTIVKKTMYLSILVQIITLLFGFYAYFTNNNHDNSHLLREILLIENVVQFIEFTFYILVAFVFTNIATKDLAKYRYFDWMVTTPLMLVTTLLYFVTVFEKDHKNSNTNSHNKKRSVIDVIKKEYLNITKMLLSNAGMLLVGYLQELGYVSLLSSNIFGFSFLVYVFYILYQYVGNQTTNILFWIMFFVWSLYGVAANFNDNIKNASYNMLDIISKNFYGVFLAFMVLKY
tara:strand:- start:7019 stop:7708 length:690 start_codon:yes stop_codon:yes gene_type:complete